MTEIREEVSTAEDRGSLECDSFSAVVPELSMGYAWLWGVAPSQFVLQLHYYRGSVFSFIVPIMPVHELS